MGYFIKPFEAWKSNGSLKERWKLFFRDPIGLLLIIINVILILLILIKE